MPAEPEGVYVGWGLPVGTWTWPSVIWETGLTGLAVLAESAELTGAEDDDDEPALTPNCEEYWKFPVPISMIRMP